MITLMPQREPILPEPARAKPFRLLITGSRELTDGRLVEHAIMDIWHRIAVTRGLVLVVGDCRTGADQFVREFADHAGIEVEVHRADWSAGKSGGPLRNQAMVASGADQCFGFLLAGAGNVGTNDCLRRARAAGIPVTEITQE